MQLLKVTPNERVLIERGINKYRVAGPGLVWLIPWERMLSCFSVSVQFFSTQLTDVRTIEDIPVTIEVQLLYRVNLNNLTDDLLPRIPGFVDGIWREIVASGVEYVLRQLVADYSWRLLGKEKTLERLQRCALGTLQSFLAFAALEPIELFLINVTLPKRLKRSIIQAECDTIDTLGRALTLKQYANTFGGDLDQLMPLIQQWEFLTTTQRKGELHFWITTDSSLQFGPYGPGSTPSQPFFQIPMPFP